MIDTSEDKNVPPAGRLFPKTIKEDGRQYEYHYYYAVKISLYKSDILKWSKAQHIFSSHPMASEDEEVIINDHIKPALKSGLEHFNISGICDRRLDLKAICRNEIAAVFLFSCREEQSVDNIMNKLSAFSRRLCVLRQFNKLSHNNSALNIKKLFIVQVKQICKQSGME